MLLNCIKLANVNSFGRYALRLNYNRVPSKSLSWTTRTFSLRQVALNGIAPYKVTRGLGKGVNSLLQIRVASSKAGNQLVKRKSDIRRLLSLAKPEKWTLLASIGCLVISSAITMTVPFAIGRVLDIIFTEAFSKERLTNFCLTLFGVFVIGGLANFGRIYLMNCACESM